MFLEIFFGSARCFDDLKEFLKKSGKTPVI